MRREEELSKEGNVLVGESIGEEEGKECRLSGCEDEARLSH